MLVKSQVKYIQSLGQKKFRDEDGVFVAEGPKIINELLIAANTSPVSIFAVKEWLSSNQKQLQTIAGDVLFEVKESELERISFLSTPNQVVAIFRKPFFEPGKLQEDIILLLDAIQDPGNMGTIIRIADWFGVKHIVCSHNSVDPFNPKVIQSTMGSISRVSVIYQDLPAFIGHHPGVPVYGALLNGEDVNKAKRIKGGMIIIGNESKGISEELLPLITNKITISGKGSAESLNAAVATGIILSHII